MLIYLCPADKKYACSWEGQSEDILHHFEEEHDDLLFFSHTFIVDPSVSSENRLLFVDDEIYLAQTRLLSKNLEIKLRYLGPSTIAEKINYNVFLKINYTLCHPDYIFVTDEGVISLNLERVEGDFGEITSLECTFNINKDLLEDTIEVFDHESESNVEVYEDVGVNEEIINEKPLPHIPNRKLSLEEKNSKHEVSLSRSKTIGIEEVKRRNVKRAKSTISLGAISETDPDYSMSCSQCGPNRILPIHLRTCEHSFCQNCESNPECKLCSELITGDRRSILLEDKFLVPCKYKKYGCPQKLLFNDITDHEASCTFCDYKCPIESCHFEGQFKHICKHIKLIHGATKVLESFIVVFYTIPEAFLVNEEKGVFYCYVKYSEDSVLWEAKFCGPKERRFFCELKFKEGKLKQPVLLTRTESVYNIRMSLQELKKLKLKAKNAILTITC